MEIIVPANDEETSNDMPPDAIELENLRLRQQWEECTRDSKRASPNSKYERYEMPVDHMDGDRSTQINLFSFKRPHMRALHCAWISFFLCFMIWFAPAPLLKEIGDTLNLTKAELWTSSITNDCSAIFTRIIMGPICDKFGARLPMSFVLIAASIPTAMVGLVNSAAHLAMLRFFIGFAGSSFVMSQFWSSRMFSSTISGTANGIVGGWGNLGGAWAQIFMGSILFPAFRDYYGSAESSWRTICIIPASMAFVWGMVLPFICDDAPMGNYKEMKQAGTMDRVFFTRSLRSGANRNTWILFIQYASCFGVELVMNNVSVLYYNARFGLDTDQAATIAFLYGSMNIFARGLGGLISDKLNTRMGMRGRLWLQTIFLIMEGLLIVTFSFMQTLPAAVVTMCLFSIFTQAAEGAIFGVVPYISKLYTGAVAGVVGSGGNVGSVVFGLAFRSLEYNQAFLIMGSIVIASSFLSLGIKIPCHAGLIWGEDNHAVIQARERYLRRREMARQQDTAETANTSEENRDESNSTVPV